MSFEQQILKGVGIRAYTKLLTLENSGSKIEPNHKSKVERLNGRIVRRIGGMRYAQQ